MKHLILIMGLFSFFGCNSQKQTNLTETLKTKYRQELKRNKEKEFTPEFIRTTNLENDIINNYGFEGVKFLFESKNSNNYYQLGEFPEDCPWKSLNKLTVSEYITKNFASIANHIPNLINVLKDRCKFIYAEKRENTWLLHYLLDMKLYDDRDYYKIYTGGAPLLNVEPNKNLQTFGWSVPSDLQTFYKIHNGFGELANINANLILSNNNIKVMAEMMNPICEKQNIKPQGYTFNQLLEFYPDGAGNAQCFYKNDGNTTVDWDHEVWQISRGVSFFEFIDNVMSKIDEE